LHTKHRIVTTLIGTLPMHPVQNVFYSKPAILPPESVTLALEKGWIRLIEDSDVLTYENIPVIIPEENVPNDTTDYASETPVESKMDETQDVKPENTAEEKRDDSAMNEDKDDSVNTSTFTDESKDDSIDEDSKQDEDEPPRKRIKLEKKPQQYVYFQLSASDARNPQKDIRHEWKYPENEEQRRRYLVYKDLHENNHYLTAGDRFGCDFLAYKDDPLIVHSEYMVFIVDYRETISPHGIVSLGRMGNTAHKTSVYATVTPEGQVKYISLNWFSNLQPLKEYKKYVIKNKAETNVEESAVAISSAATVPTDVVISGD
jgi:tRNA-splicing endonuclease subunit Sen34